MRRKEIEQIAWLAPASKNKCVISAMVMPAKEAKIGRASCRERV